MPMSTTARRSDIRFDPALSLDQGVSDISPYIDGMTFWIQQHIFSVLLHRLLSPTVWPLNWAGALVGGFSSPNRLDGARADGRRFGTVVQTSRPTLRSCIDFFLALWLGFSQLF